MRRLWESEPLVAVTLTLYVPVTALAEVTFNVELPAPFEASTTLPGLRFANGPEGETDADKVTVPENPLRLATVMADVPEDPCAMVNEVGFADTLKSGATVIW
jgi:hypothetical protein